MLSIIIPTYQAAHQLGATVTPLQTAVAEEHIEIIISDGGSTDATKRIAKAFGLKTIVSPKGRGAQLRHGALAATEDWFLFLHADTRLEENWWDVVQEFISNKKHRFHAAYFLFALDDECPQARRIEKLVDWRCQHLNLPYGDQGLLISRDLYEYLGGYPDQPIMEDVDLVQRIGGERLHCLPVTATTSAARYQRDGYIKRPLRNLTCLALHFLGIPSATINKLYQ